MLDENDRRTPDSRHYRGGQIQATWAKLVVCAQCEWKKHLESRAEDHGAHACRLAMARHRKSTGHKQFAIFDGQVRQKRRPRLKAVELEGAGSPAAGPGLPEVPA